MKKLVTLSVATVIASLLLVGCASTSEKTETSTDAKMTVTDSLGEKVDVSQNPEKVVVFDNGSLDTLDALGVGDSVVGAATDSLPNYLSAYKNVDSAGGIKEPDVEKINSLNPGLILISGRQQDYKDQLNAIAPTLYLDSSSGDYWEKTQTNVTTLAKIFNKEDEAKKEIASLQKNIDSLRSKAEASSQKALILLVNDGSLSAYGAGSRFGVIHDDFGFAQADENIEVSTHGQSVSYEYVLEKNPDIIFVIDRSQAIGEDTSKDNISENELIKETNAGKNNKIVTLQPDVWYLSGGGLESTKLMIEDAEKALD